MAGDGAGLMTRVKITGAVLLVLAAGIIWFDRDPVDITPRPADDEREVTFEVTWTDKNAEMRAVQYGLASGPFVQRNVRGGDWSSRKSFPVGTRVELHAQFVRNPGDPGCRMLIENVVPEGAAWRSGGTWCSANAIVR